MTLQIGFERVLIVEWQQGAALIAIPDTLGRIREAGNAYETYAMSGLFAGRELQIQTELEAVIARVQPDAILWIRKPVQVGDPLPEPVSAGTVPLLPLEQRAQQLVFRTVAQRSTAASYLYETSSQDLQVLKHKGRTKNILVQTNNPIMDPFAGFQYDLFQKLDDKNRKPAMLPTLLLTVLFFVLGTVVAFIGGVIHSMSSSIPGTEIVLPFGLVVAVLIVALVTNAARGMLSSKIPLLGVIAGIVFTIVLMSMYQIQGTLFIQDTMMGIGWLIFGALVPLMVALWPKFPHYYPEIV